MLSRDTLKVLYKEFLSQLQPHIPTSHSREIEFVKDYKKSQSLVECFNSNLKKEGIDKLISDESISESSLLNLQKHLQILSDLDPDLYSLFSLVINIIFCGGSSYAIGGTTSAAIGIVWGNPEKKWKVCDYLEYFIHELTHTLMFLDEFRFLHYIDQECMHQKENFSMSAILKAERPIDRVLHSIVVATEVILLRMRVLVDHSECYIHPSTDRLIESTRISIEKLFSHPNRDVLLTPRAFRIAECCHSSISSYLSHSP